MMGSFSAENFFEANIYANHQNLKKNASRETFFQFIWEMEQIGQMELQGTTQSILDQEKDTGDERIKLLAQELNVWILSILGETQQGVSEQQIELIGRNLIRPYKRLLRKTQADT